MTELPQGFLTILNGVFTNDVHTVFYMNLANLLDLLSLINCYVGFIAYCFLCTKYQQTFVLMIVTWYKFTNLSNYLQKLSNDTFFKCFGIKRNTENQNRNRRQRSSRKRSAYKKGFVSTNKTCYTDCEYNVQVSDFLTNVSNLKQPETVMYIEENSSVTNTGSSDYSISGASPCSENDHKQHILMPRFDSKLDICL